jgi:hypothetical protein
MTLRSHVAPALRTTSRLHRLGIDGGGEGDPVDLSQNITSWTGKMLQIDAYHRCMPYPRH